LADIFDKYFFEKNFWKSKSFAKNFLNKKTCVKFLLQKTFENQKLFAFFWQKSF
jgi:hypothetical protein